MKVQIAYFISFLLTIALVGCSTTQTHAGVAGFDSGVGAASSEAQGAASSLTYVDPEYHTDYAAAPMTYRDLAAELNEEAGQYPKRLSTLITVERVEPVRDGEIRFDYSLSRPKSTLSLPEIRFFAGTIDDECAKSSFRNMSLRGIRAVDYEFTNPDGSPAFSYQIRPTDCWEAPSFRMLPRLSAEELEKIASGIVTREARNRVLKFKKAQVRDGVVYVSIDTDVTDVNYLPVFYTGLFVPFCSKATGLYMLRRGLVIRSVINGRYDPQMDLSIASCQRTLPQMAAQIDASMHLVDSERREMQQKGIPSSPDSSGMGT